MVGLENLARRVLRRAMTELAIRLLDVQGRVAQRTLPKFANQPKHLSIDLPRRIIHPERISLGDHVWLGPGCFIAAVTDYPSASMRDPDSRGEAQSFSPHISIGDRVTSTGNLIIGAVQQVDIADDVMFAFNVTLLDNLHGFDHVNEAYKYQPIGRIAPVGIGRGCWVGQNAVILPGVEIGEMSIIGANSVVTHSVPPRSIAVGAPARVIKQWDEKNKRWRACTEVPSARANSR
jgi:acetyltransferase-like isoleucine patch superfamily enzyme